MDKPMSSKCYVRQFSTQEFGDKTRFYMFYMLMSPATTENPVQIKKPTELSLKYHNGNGKRKLNKWAQFQFISAIVSDQSYGMDARRENQTEVRRENQTDIYLFC